MTSEPPQSRPLSIHETGFVDLHSSETPQVISGICFLNGPVERSLLIDRLKEFVDAHPLYSHYMSAGSRPDWIQTENFRLEDHVTDVGSTTREPDAFVSLIAEKAALGFDAQQPPWKVWLTNTEREDGRREGAVAFSAHHSLVDGLEAFELFYALTDRSQSNPRFSSHQGESILTRSRRSMLNWNCVKAVSRDLTLRRFSSPFSGENSSRRQTFVLNWPRSAFARARKCYDASLQELLLTVLTMGFKKYCGPRGGARHLRAILPLGSRASASEAGVTNRHDPGLILLPLAGESPRDCILTIRQRLDDLRQQQRQSVFETMTAFFEHLPRMVRARAAMRWTGLSNLLISVIPGPPRLPAIGGATIESILALPALAPGHGLTVGIVCLRKTICIAAHLDPAILTSPEELRRDLEETYREVIENCEHSD